MRLLFRAVIAIASLVVPPAAIAQSAPVAATDSPATANPAVAAPAPLGKRMACQTASRAVTGQAETDQIQLCTAQARLDRPKQAIDQKIVGPQRRDFVKNCAEEF
jgi:hypothetical protein